MAAPRDPSFEEFTPDGNRRCQRRSKNRGGQCGAIAMRGQDVCRFHGGASPRARAKAQERLAEEKARGLMATYGRKIETTATEALIAEVQWTAGHVAWLRERVQEIEAAAEPGSENALVWGVTKKKTGGEDFGTTEEAVPNIWLKLYQAERAHLVSVCAQAIKAGIEERRIRLAESQGELVAHAIRAILADLGLSAEQQALVPEVVPRHLRLIASG
jgi:hypothetical protein